MLKKIKNFLRSKKTFLFLAILPVLGFLFFPHPARAAWYSFLIGAVIAIPMYTLFLYLYIGGIISTIFSALCSLTLQWITGPNFTSLSYTNPARNEIIKVGLGVTQGFVNIILVLVLVFIAIATILRLENYKTKTLLKNFIIVALLVNFAPVICGLIVDASNIMMNFFLSKISAGQQLVNGFGAMTKNFTSTFGDWKNASATWPIENALFLLVMIMVNTVTGLLLLIFAFVFLLRYIMIWFLVILSPLAFASYILPFTKNLVYDKWKTQFIQWSIVGITCGFFLYLSDLFVTVIADKKPFNVATGIGSSVLPSFVPLVFLGAALILGLQTGATGASVITSFGRKQINKLGTLSRKGATGWVKERGAAIREKMPAGVKKFAERMATAPTKWGEGQTGGWGFAKRYISAPIYHARRTVGLGLQQIVGEEGDKARIETTEASIKESDSAADTLSKFHRETTKTGKIGILNGAIKHGQLKDMRDVEKFGNGAVKESDVKSLMPMAKKLNFDKKLNSAFPTIARDLLKDTDDEVIKTNQDQEFIEAREKMPGIDAKTWTILNKLKPNDFKNMQESEFLEDVKTQDVFLATAMGSHLSQLVEGMGKKAVLTLEKRTKELSRGSGKSPSSWLKDLNPRLHKSFISGPNSGLINLSDAKEAGQSKTIITDTSQSAFEEAKKSSEHQDPKGRTASGALKDNMKPPRGRSL